MSEIEFELRFSDVTLNETEGVYKNVNERMLSELPFETKWVLRSDLSILSSVGMCNMEIQLHSDKSVYILSYQPSIGELFYNPDLQVLSQWCQKNGWKIPQPHFDLVRENKEFWKHFYDTLVIDSEYLDKIYGKRNFEN